MKEFNFGLYPVITEEFCAGRSIYEILNGVIEGGVKIVQLRQKNISKKNLFEQAIQFRKITLKKNVKLIINDHIDIALACKADGVHLGQEDLPCLAARKLAPKMIIGISTHNLEEIKKAEHEKATYINIGPVFSTNTKETRINPLGIDFLKSTKIKLPFSVMGGIKKENIISLLEYGVKNIALITEITMAENVAEKTKELIKIINGHN